MIRITAMVILVFTSLLQANELRKAIELSRQGDHEASEVILSKIKDRTPEYDFYRMINNFCLNKKEEAERYATNLEHSFGDKEIPQRYKDMAIIINAECSVWEKHPKDLSNIARDMGKISNRLANSKGGKETRKMQEDVLKRIGSLIKDLEDKKNKENQQGEGGDDQDQQKKGADGQGGKSATPATDTIRPNEQGTGEVDPKKVKEIAEVWGKLPEKERAKALVGISRLMPAKDKAVIEKYLRELQIRSSKK